MLLPLQLHPFLQVLVEHRLLGLLLRGVLILMIQSFEDGLSTEDVFVDQQRSALVVGSAHSSLINFLWNKNTIKILLQTWPYEGIRGSA